MKAAPPDEVDRDGGDRGSASRPVVTFDRVSFRYAPVAGGAGAPEGWVLRDLSLSLPQGQFLGVIGPNGAGKSTVVRLILGVIEPTAGTVLLDGREPRRLPARERARRVAAVTQEEPIEFPFTALEVVLMGRIAHLPPLGFEGPADLAAAEEAMAATGVAGFAERPFHALSGGERKRVLLARALAQQAPLLVLDEPAAALDIHHQIAIFDLLADRNRQGATVVVVVHDLNLAAAYCRRLLLLPLEQPALDGSVEEILTYRRVRDVFGVEVYVGVNELTGDRLLIPMSSKRVT